MNPLQSNLYIAVNCQLSQPRTGGGFYYLSTKVTRVVVCIQFLNKYNNLQI